MNVLQYNDIRILDLTWDDLMSSPDLSNCFTADITHVRAGLPSNRPECIPILLKNKFFFVDRTILATVNLKRLNTGLKKLVRFDVQPEELSVNEIIPMAQLAFSVDRRFHLDPTFNKVCAEKALRGFVQKLLSEPHCTLVCRYKNDIIGITILTPHGSDQELALGLVRTDFQRTGAALSLYYATCEHALMLGSSRLCGRISSANTAVINLYALLGAQFSEPHDLYFKQIIQQFNTAEKGGQKR